MSYPAIIPQTLLTIGTAVDWWADAVTLEAEVTPILGGGARKITHEATGAPMLARAKRFKSQAGGYLEFHVPSSDPTGWRDGSGQEPGPWAYHVAVTVTFVDRTTYKWDKTVKPLPDQRTIDLDLVTDGVVVPGVSAPVAPVTSVNGLTGAVNIDGGSGGQIDLSDYATTAELMAKADQETVSDLQTRVKGLEDGAALTHDSIYVLDPDSGRLVQEAA
ncbi:hypothetical protein [Kocuria sp.]|uniref:hypothetical protein n=1 Tax=Kocuria sp. TaxID=1871328 RepID=UPI0026DEB18C|nr:hypothetical protein [Kocuria sp.]MDO5619259.1 hypothetical protein [Kocuria sp.]